MIQPPELVSAYRATCYQVLFPGEVLSLRIGLASVALVRYLQLAGVVEFAIITAENPASRLCTEFENQLAGAQLQSALVAAGFSPVATRHLADDDRWSVENGFYVNGLARSAARALAAKYGQNAFLWGGADGVPHLVWTDDEEKDEASDWTL